MFKFRAPRIVSGQSKVPQAIWKTCSEPVLKLVLTKFVDQSDHDAADVEVTPNPEGPLHLEVRHEDGQVPRPVADDDVASSHPAHFLARKFKFFKFTNQSKNRYDVEWKKLVWSLFSLAHLADFLFHLLIKPPKNFFTSFGSWNSKKSFLKF